ncbi:glycosyltransferase family 2 protein [Kocuria rosea]|uniref:glycosyltransferase family 2 protein n=1 Tax=Kocuria rosea TaxID=1275 RepID=UPI0016438149|nr:glycosyltransferase [Kocuria rosea]
MTVIMPLKNASNYLSEAFRGLERIDFTGWEIIVVDDGSTDNTYELVNDWAGVPGVECHILRHADSKGVAAARNAAVEKARGEFVWFVDGDDSWSSDIVSELWAGRDSNATDLVVCDAVRIVEATNHTSRINDASSKAAITGREALGRIFTGELQGHLWNKLVRTELLLRHPFPIMRAHSDLAGLINLLPYARSVSFVPKAMYTYQVHEGSIIQSPQYKWDDLHKCADHAEATVNLHAMNKEFHRKLRIFKITHVLIPVAHDLISRKEKAIHRAPFYGDLVPSVIIGMLASGRAILAAQSAMIRYLPGVYATIYKTHLRRRWAK